MCQLGSLFSEKIQIYFRRGLSGLLVLMIMGSITKIFNGEISAISITALAIQIIILLSLVDTGGKFIKYAGQSLAFLLALLMPIFLLVLNNRGAEYKLSILIAPSVVGLISLIIFLVLFKNIGNET